MKFIKILVFFLIISLSTLIDIKADELDLDEGTISTFSSKRGIKKTKKKKINHSLFEISLKYYDPRKEQYIELRDLSQISSDQQFAISITPLKEINLYIFNIDSSNNLSVLFPHPSILKKNPLEENKTILFPDTKELMYEFSGKPGIERIFIFASVDSNSDFFAASTRIPYEGLRFGTKGHIGLYKMILENYEKLKDKKPSAFQEEQAVRYVLIHKKHPESDLDQKVYNEAKKMLGTYQKEQ